MIFLGACLALELRGEELRSNGCSSVAGHPRPTGVGFHKVVSQNDQRIQKTGAGVYLDLSAIAKGYAVDYLADYLESLGISRYMVEIGGEVRAQGRHRPQRRQGGEILPLPPGGSTARAGRSALELAATSVEAAVSTGW